MVTDRDRTYRAVGEETPVDRDLRRYRDDRDGPGGHNEPAQCKVHSSLFLAFGVDDAKLGGTRSFHSRVIYSISSVGIDS